MQWYRGLTPQQRRVLLALFGATALVLVLLVGSVWSTLRSAPLPTPTTTLTETNVLISHVLTPSPTLFVLPTPTPTPPFDPLEAGTIAEEVAVARGTIARWGTPLKLVEQHELTTALYQRYQTLPPFTLQAKTTLDILGLWFWDEPVRIDTRAQARVAAAIYVPEEEQIYLRRDWTGSLEDLKIQLAFGYARAIPEQYGDLQRLQDEADTLDRHLALSAIADGDALIALWRYYELKPGTPQANALLTTLIQATTAHWIPEDPLLSDLSRLSLELGGTFATELYNKGGTEALDMALRRPPRSTHEVLHPEHYLEGDNARVISPLTPELGRGWILTHTDTLGEALMGLTLLEWRGKETLTTTLPYWDGDLLQAWDGPQGACVVLWQTAWKDWHEARHFYNEMTTLLPNRVAGYTRETPAPETLPAGQWWVGDKGAAFLYRYSDRVWLVWGTDPEAVETVGVSLKDAR
ncbi:MAG: hypothetical protein JXA33_27790 [Anaerolineae bacterium]|nr:hypothetical protein [Anaerolineae bacterium]